MAAEGTEMATVPPTSANPATAPSDLPFVNIGTRRSLLARVQTDIVEAALREAWPDRKYEIHAMATMGDKNQATPLHEMGAKSLWTHELEALLVEGKLDMIVHSLKDMPTQLPPDLSIGAIFPREDPRDAFVLKASLAADPSTASKLYTLATLPAGSVIGTSSVRRAAQLKRLYPQLKFADVRGNVGTRLSKLDSTDPDAVQYTALILAAAGLKRLGLEGRITSYLSKKDGGMLHAVGQGAIGVEIRSDDEATKVLLSKVGCERTTKACLAERSLMRTLEGGCSVPIGVETEWVSVSPSTSTSTSTVGVQPAAQYDQTTGKPVEPTIGSAGSSSSSSSSKSNELTMRAAVVSLDGSEVAEVELTRRIDTREQADEFGRTVAAALVEKGADKILEKINLNRDIIATQAGGA